MRNIVCTNGETCWAEECCNAGFCMHADEAQPLQWPGFDSYNDTIADVDAFNDRKGGGVW